MANENTNNNTGVLADLLIKIGVLVVIFVIIYGLCGEGLLGPLFDGVSGENFKFASKDEARVYVHPVCPECDHVDTAIGLNISKGEDETFTHYCDKCYAVYEVEVER